MFKAVKTMFVSFNVLVVLAMIGIAVPAVTSKADTNLADTIVLKWDENGKLTNDSYMAIEKIPFSKRDDKEFFLIHPEKYPQEYCMAQNIYFEAGIDNKAGMAAVADVTLNRVKDNRYPNTVCEVVKQGKQKPSWKDPNKMVMVRNMCQFSWYCDGKSDDVPLGSENWVKAQMMAWEMMHEGTLKGITEGSTHYHATYVNPSWNRMKNLDLVGRIGLHIFYRWN